MEKFLKSVYLDRLQNALETQQRTKEEIVTCTQYAQKLMADNLPVLFEENHVYQVLKWKKSNQQQYHTFYLVQKGKEREITAPSRELKRRQRWILDNILTKLKISDYAHGFVKNRSIRTNAELHMTHDYALCMDIEDFFPSIKEDTVKEVFARAGYSRRAANALADMCCYFAALPQGAPTSPYLANLVFIEKDHELALLAKQHDATYSRYADDLTFSSDNPLGNLSDAVNQVLQNNGFRLNDSKTKEFFPGQPKRITGLIVQNGLIRVPRKFKRTLKQEIYYCKRYGVALHLENTRAHKTINYREYLYGKAYYINMIEPELGKHYLKQLDEIHWPSYYL